MDKIKEFRNAVLIIAGSIIGSMVGSKVVKTVLDWTGENVKKED